MLDYGGALVLNSLAYSLGEADGSERPQTPMIALATSGTTKAYGSCCPGNLASATKVSGYRVVPLRPRCFSPAVHKVVERGD
jgi:hypothetical protein